MTTREWARRLRHQQDTERKDSTENRRAIADQADSVWQDLVQELHSGLEGYGPPPHGSHKTAPANHVWWVKLLVESPNKGTELRGVNVVHEIAAHKIRVTYSGVKAEEFSVHIDVLATGAVGLRLADHDATVPDVAQKILTPFLS